VGQKKKRPGGKGQKKKNKKPTNVSRLGSMGTKEGVRNKKKQKKEWEWSEGVRQAC